MSWKGRLDTMDLPTDMLKRNYQVPRRVADWLDEQQEQGISMQGIMRWAVYWYANRLTPAGRARPATKQKYGSRLG